MDEKRRTLAARREHSKGNGNFPEPEPTVTVLERPEDRMPEDLPKDPELPTPDSGFEMAARAADDATSEPVRPAARPNTRRAPSAKREAAPAKRARPRPEAKVTRAPKRSAKKAARGNVPARKAKKASRAKGRRSAR